VSLFPPVMRMLWLKLFWRCMECRNRTLKGWGDCQESILKCILIGIPCWTNWMDG